MKSVSLAVFVLSLALPPAAPAQPRPDFSGTWTMDLTRSDSAIQTDPIGPTTVTIEQTALEMRMAIARDGKTANITYRLDGAPSAIPGGTATSHWDGGSLVTETVRTIQGQTVTMNEVRRLSAASDEMFVDSVLVVQHGYTLKGTQNYGAGRDVFVRAR
jgi:hypothetical protein